MALVVDLIHGFQVAFVPLNLLLAFGGALAGTVIGALPGLGPANGVAILIPLSFTLGLRPESSLILLAGVYYGAMYGGRISSILLNIPGDEPAVMTTLDGYPMTKSGRGGAALAISAVASFVGSTIATVGLMVFAPLLANLAIQFGPAEYFALYVMAFSTLGGIAGGSPIRALTSAVLGLMIATVGLDPASGVPRYTFGTMQFYDGVNFLDVIVGIFAVSEVLVFIESRHAGEVVRYKVGRVAARLRDVVKTLGTMLRSSVIGFIAGVLPGAGASIGSFLSYTFEKRLVDRDGTFGKGDPRGVAAPEAGNNAAAGGALVPMLTLGVPGSGTTAVLLAMLLEFNITPGPLLFKQHPEVVWGLIASLYLGNIVLLVLNLPLVGVFVRLLALPGWVLMPSVTMIAFMGIYSISHSVFDILLMIGFGVLGYILRKLRIPLVPLILGVLLGDDVELNLRRAMTLSNGNVLALFHSTLSIVLWLMALTSLLAPILLFRRRGRAVSESASGSEASGGEEHAEMHADVEDVLPTDSHDEG